jgi:hypothetical protein
MRADYMLSVEGREAVVDEFRGHDEYYNVHHDPEDIANAYGNLSPEFCIEEAKKDGPSAAT